MDKKAMQLRVVNLDDEQILELIRGNPLLLENSIGETICVCNGFTNDEIHDALKSMLGPDNVIVVGKDVPPQKLDG